MNCFEKVLAGGYPLVVPHTVGAPQGFGSSPT